jgi:16S rRNA (cytidine1402-2'-O)-methyltransferase
VVARELTKLHEELYRGTAGEALAHFGTTQVRGELVLMLPPVAPEAPALEAGDELRRLIVEEGVARSVAVRQVAKACGLPRSEVYRASLAFDRPAAPDEDQ